MSLTNFLKNKDVKEEFARHFPKPRFSLKKDLLAPPRTTHYGLVGTAFDYLLQFYLERLNPGAITKAWIAEWSIKSPSSPLLTNVVIDIDTGKVSFAETKLTRKAQGIIEQAKAIRSAYFSSGEITDEAIACALRLAQLDPICRIGYIDENLGIVHSEDVADLRQLITIVDPAIFRAEELCVLNPTFGEASKLVSGADGDVVIDDLLIDAKTTKNLRLTRDDFNQLIGYYVLARIGGIDNTPHPPTIERVGIYFSRHAELYTIPINSVVDDEKLPAFIEWFTKRAASEYPPMKLH
jgi:hypothetical protein